MQVQSNALIGNTGFVGSNILNQHSFTHLYNSKNIEDIQDKNFDLVACAAAPGTKWLANKNPENDLASIEKLIKNLEKITAKKFILISTIDVYSAVDGVDEDTHPSSDRLLPYGKHRLMLEEFAQTHFDSLIIRLPGIFGKGLKKNILFDLIHHACPPINNASTFQFYFLDRIWSDIKKCLKNNLGIVNFATEPISVKEITNKIFHLDLPSNQETPIYYDMHTKHAHLWGNSKPYLYLKNEILADIKLFANKQ